MFSGLPTFPSSPDLFHPFLSKHRIVWKFKQGDIIARGVRTTSSNTAAYHFSGKKKCRATKMHFWNAAEKLSFPWWRHRNHTQKLKQDGEWSRVGISRRFFPAGESGWCWYPLLKCSVVMSSFICKDFNIFSCNSPFKNNFSFQRCIMPCLVLLRSNPLHSFYVTQVMHNPIHFIWHTFSIVLPYLLPGALLARMYINQATFLFVWTDVPKL